MSKNKLFNRQQKIVLRDIFKLLRERFNGLEMKYWKSDLNWRLNLAVADLYCSNLKSMRTKDVVETVVVVVVVVDVVACWIEMMSPCSRIDFDMKHLSNFEDHHLGTADVAVAAAAAVVVAVGYYMCMDLVDDCGEIRIVVVVAEMDGVVVVVVVEAVATVVGFVVELLDNKKNMLI
jgi:hypothetical protein